MKRFYSFLYFRVRPKKDFSANRIKMFFFVVFEEKSDNHARYSKYRCVYALLISFVKQFKKLLFYLIEHALRSLLVFKYLRLFLRKGKITAGDTLNPRLFNLTFRRKKPERSRVRLLVYLYTLSSNLLI